jgi:hypothetical protein
LDELKTVTRSLKLRVREVDLRPKKLQELQDTLNMTEHFLHATRNLFSKKDNDDENPFTEVEIKYLEKTIKDTYVSNSINYPEKKILFLKIWRDQALIEFSKLLPTDTPKYLSTDFDEKMNALKRETNYLLTKAQRFVPKPKTTPKVPVKDDETKTTTASTEGIYYIHH